MGCLSCQERAKAMIETGRALARGDLHKASQQSQLVVKTIERDIGAGIKAAAAVARSRLQGRSK